MTIDDYLQLPYTLSVKPDYDDKGNTGFTAKVEELPGCVAQGETRVKALENLDEAMRAWLEVALADGTPIPTPRQESTYSGRILLRLPASLHAELARAAEAEGTSLNQFLVAALAGAVGWRAAAPTKWPVETAEPAESVWGGKYKLAVGTNAQLFRAYGGIFEKEPIINYLTVDVLPIEDADVTVLKGQGVETVGDLVKESLDAHGVKFVIADE